MFCVVFVFCLFLCWSLSVDTRTGTKGTRAHTHTEQKKKQHNIINKFKVNKEEQITYQGKLISPRCECDSLCFLVFLLSHLHYHCERSCLHVCFCRPTEVQRWVFVGKKMRTEQKPQCPAVCLSRVTGPKLNHQNSVMNLEPLRQSKKIPSDLGYRYDDRLVLGKNCDSVQM